jgi:hypothetical protein
MQKKKKKINKSKNKNCLSIIKKHLKLLCKLEPKYTGMKFGSSLQTILILFDLTKPWLPQAIIVSHWPVCKKVFPSETTVQIGFKLYRNCVNNKCHIKW